MHGTVITWVTYVTSAVDT